MCVPHIHTTALLPKMFIRSPFTHVCVHIICIGDIQLRKEHVCNSRCANFSPSNQTYAAMSDDNLIYIWDCNTGNYYLFSIIILYSILYVLCVNVVRGVLCAYFFPHTLFILYESCLRVCCACVRMNCVCVFDI